MKLKSKPFAKKLLLQSLVCASALGGATASFAQAYQAFFGINYSNPAALNIVNNFEMIVGGDEILLNSQFNGSFGTTSGSMTSRTNSFLPYGRLAYRLNPDMVIGVDITQPLFFSFAYPTPSFADQASINTSIRDVDISPRISWQATKKLALGLGLNINNLYEATFAFRVAPFGSLSNKGDAWGLGWNAGLLYNPMLGTYAGLSYYSKIVQHVSGSSTWGALRNNYTATSAIVPATINANVVQFVRRNWLFNATVRYTFWDPVRYLNIANTALPGASKTVTVPQFFNNGFDYSLGTKYEFNDKWAGLGLIELNPNMQPLAYRGIGLPTGTAWILAIGGEYTIQKGLKAKLIYGHVFEHPQINKQYSTGLALGRINLDVNSFDFSITYDV